MLRMLLKRVIGLQRPLTVFHAHISDGSFLDRSRPNVNVTYQRVCSFHRSQARNMETKPRRAMLYVPGSDERKLKKLTDLEVDCAVMDCEDGVAVNKKVKFEGLWETPVFGWWVTEWLVRGRGGWGGAGGEGGSRSSCNIGHCVAPVG